MSAENAKLRAESTASEAEEADRKRKETIETLKILDKNKRKLHVWKKLGTKFEYECTKSLYQIFCYLAPELHIEKSTEAISHFSAIAICQISHVEIRDNWPVPANEINSWLSDFSTLDLVRPSTKKKPVSDDANYWMLTEKGKEVLHWIRRSVLKKGSQPDSVNASDKSQGSAEDRQLEKTTAKKTTAKKTTAKKTTAKKTTAKKRQGNKKQAKSRQ